MEADLQPSNEVFEDIKQAAIKVWNGYDNTYGYVDEKLDRIMPIKNVKDNWYTFLGMMDVHNQRKLMLNLKNEASIVFLLDFELKYGYNIPVERWKDGRTGIN